MATVTDYVKGKVAFFDLGGKKHYAENTLDFSETPVQSGDIVQAVKVPWGAFVTDVYAVVHTVQGATTIDLGDDADDNGYDTAVDVSAVGVTKADAAAYADGVHYVRPQADTKSKFSTVNIKANGNLNTLKVTIVVEYARLETVPTAE